MSIWEKITDAAAALASGPAQALAILRGTNVPARGDAKKDVTFTIAVIALAAKMAAADGVVVPIEVATFERLFQVDPDQVRNVSRVFDLAKQDTAGFEVYAEQIGRIMKDDRALLMHVLEGLFHIASADRVLHEREQDFLHTVADRLGLSASEYDHVRAMFVEGTASPYDVLGLTPSATDEEIKARHRKLVRENHPDLFMRDGVPPEFAVVADRKLAAINAAFGRLKADRGL
jgi:DnaJ like chaperone protein